MPDCIDLDAYFQRIAYTGSRAPTLQTLHALTRAHAQAIPFETIDTLLSHVIPLDMAEVFEKLVLRRRGGYCFEQNGLFLQVLQQLGFKTRALGARVRHRVTDRAELPRRTHMLIEVMLDEARWLTDVGIGISTLTQALRLVPGIEQQTPHDRRRLERQGRIWFQQIWRDGAWHDAYQFTLDDFPPVDRDVANWYTSTNPNDSFRRELMLAIARPDGGRTTLFGCALTLHAADGTRRKESLETAPQMAAALREHFGIVLPADTEARLAQKLGLQAAS